jgi:hypothetical protein
LSITSQVEENYSTFLSKDLVSTARIKTFLNERFFFVLSTSIRQFNVANPLSQIFMVNAILNLIRNINRQLKINNFYQSSYGNISVADFLDSAPEPRSFRKR